MDLKCSVLGHRFGDQEHREERDQQGDEVVSTVREVEICDRCEKTRIISESKEVRSLNQTESDDEQSASEASPDTVPDQSTVGSSTAFGSGFGGTGDDLTDTEGSGGIILDEETTETNRGADETAPGMTGSPTETTDTSGGEWPSVSDQDQGVSMVTQNGQTNGAEELLAGAPNSDNGQQAQRSKRSGGFARATSMQGNQSGGHYVEGEYYCPECQWETPILNAPVRMGDICPQCRHGYIAERDPR